MFTLGFFIRHFAMALKIWGNPKLALNLRKACVFLIEVVGFPLWICGCIHETYITRIIPCSISLSREL